MKVSIVNGEIILDDEGKIAMRDALKRGVFQTNKKCCQKCAFRKGSPERTNDPYYWMNLHEAAENGSPFFCHESIPGHTQHENDGRPNFRLCAGMEAMKKNPDKMLDLFDFKTHNQKEESKGHAE